MPEAGKYDVKLKWRVAEDVVRPDVLECFAYEDLNAGNWPQIVYTKTEEFSAVCPFSGLPDIAKLEICYIPQSLVLELKSLKQYVVSYRDAGIYQEEATVLIWQHIAKTIFSSKCLPNIQRSRLAVSTTYQTRGGFDTTCTIGDDVLMERGRA